jgi:hypothetical protein
MRQISGDGNNTVYAIGSDDAVWVNSGNGWNSLGSVARQISAGVDAAGNPEIFAIGSNDAVWANDGNEWNSLGGFARLIDAPNKDVSVPGDLVYAIGADHTDWVHDATGWNSLSQENTDPPPGGGAALPPPQGSKGALPTQQTFSEASLVRGEDSGAPLGKVHKLSGDSFFDVEDLYLSR